MATEITGEELIAAILADDELGAEPAPPSEIMRFEIDRGVFRQLLAKALAVVPTRDAMEVLKCVQLQLDRQRLRVVASSSTFTLISSTNQVSVSTAGTIVFPAKKLFEIVRAGNADTVKIVVVGLVATVTIGRASWSVHLPGGFDFPPLPATSDAQFCDVDINQFEVAIGRVRVAAGRDANRPSLSVIVIQDGKVTAADGARLHQVNLGTDFPFNLRIPILAIDDLLRLIRVSDADTITVGLAEDGGLIFRLGSDLFIVNRFNTPEVDLQAQMISPVLKNKHRLEVNRADLVAAVKRVRVIVDPKSSVAVSLALSGNELTVSAREEDQNRASETIDCAWSGPERTITVNHKHLTDLLGAQVEDDTCVLLLGTDTKTRRLPILLPASTGSLGIIHQMSE